MKRTVREDERGPFILVGGSAHRPDNSFHRWGAVLHLDGEWRGVASSTKYKAGDKVRVRDRAYTAFILVGPGDSDCEVWTSYYCEEYPS